MIQLEMDWKLSGLVFPHRIIQVRRGATVRELLSLLDMEAMSGELIIIYNGLSVNLADHLDKDGKVVVLPLICGG